MLIRSARLRILFDPTTSLDTVTELFRTPTGDNDLEISLYLTADESEAYRALLEHAAASSLSPGPLNGLDVEPIAPRPEADLDPVPNCPFPWLSSRHRVLRFKSTELQQTFVAAVLAAAQAGQIATFARTRPEAKALANSFHAEGEASWVAFLASEKAKEKGWRVAKAAAATE